MYLPASLFLSKFLNGICEYPIQLLYQWTHHPRLFYHPQVCDTFLAGPSWHHSRVIWGWVFTPPARYFYCGLTGVGWLLPPHKMPPEESKPLDTILV